MKWRGRQGSSNIEDRRGRRTAQAGGLGIFGLLALWAIGSFLGVDVSSLMNSGSVPGQATSTSTTLTAEDQAAGEFVSVTLADTEQVWATVLAREANRTYRPATLVLFKGTTQSPCGNASGATGPFYCPADRKVYLDTDFFTTMERQMGARGDFAAAYVVAHEVAHHVQNELGILPQANAARQRMSKVESNRVSVMIELQADCFSGIWARYVSEKLGTLEEGDIQEAINAAKQIGDDMIQRNAGRRPMPHTFTHGTSEQRQRWFAKGYQNPRLDQCDTFNGQQL
ncbi:membrane protein [Amylibacter ulvae]|uniref:Membrane protein n=1 Tax=Paramylibacter ulvae TaxID=1651968 RepID=A0ABQ3CTN4_9RHOB|nr:neutral zinc metallopeptidase [Amylibacter ulvae]GHA43283.1 membrane protein [Amylibacter ulvae]